MNCIKRIQRIIMIIGVVFVGTSPAEAQDFISIYEEYKPTVRKEMHEVHAVPVDNAVHVNSTLSNETHNSDGVLVEIVINGIRAMLESWV